MYGIFLLDTQRLAPPLHGRPLAACWIANGPVLHQIVNSWANELQYVEVWAPDNQLAWFEKWLTEIPLGVPAKLKGYDPAAGFPAKKLRAAVGTLPQDDILIMTDTRIIIPGLSFKKDPAAGCGIIGPTAAWFDGPRTLAGHLPAEDIQWGKWADALDGDGPLPVDWQYPLTDDGVAGGQNRAFLDTNRRLLAIGRSSSDALERSYTEEFSVIPPVYIDAGAEIFTSVIGPYAAIGPGAYVANAIVRQSVIDQGAEINDVLLESSIIGPGASLAGTFDQRQIGPLKE